MKTRYTILIITAIIIISFLIFMWFGPYSFSCNWTGWDNPLPQIPIPSSDVRCAFYETQYSPNSGWYVDEN